MRIGYTLHGSLFVAALLAAAPIRAEVSINNLPKHPASTTSSSSSRGGITGPNLQSVGTCKLVAPVGEEPETNADYECNDNSHGLATTRFLCPKGPFPRFVQGAKWNAGQGTLMSDAPTAISLGCSKEGGSSGLGSMSH